MKKLLKGIINLSIVTSIIFLMIPFNIHADSMISVTYSYAKAKDYIAGVNHAAYNSSTGVTNHLYFEFKGNVYGTISFKDLSNNINYNIAVSGSSYDFSYTKANNGNYISSIDIFSANLYSEKDWNFPIESYSVASYMLRNSSAQLDGLVNVNDYQYPMFLYPKGTNYYIYGFYAYADETRDFVFNFIGSGNINNLTRFNQYFDIMGTGEGGGTFYDFKRLYTIGMVYDRSGTELGFGYLYSVKVHGNDGFVYIRLIQSLRPSFFMIPIYGNYIDNTYISTDFALNYGLSNQLLDDIHNFTSGNQEAIDAGNALDQSTNTMQDQMDDMVDIESGYNQQFNNSLNDIDFTNPIQNNAGILPAANFVITAFNGLVNNPLSILIIIICILTIGKKVIGK